jgi:hypothetical protein
MARFGEQQRKRDGENEMLKDEEQQQDISRQTSMLTGEDEGGRPSTAGAVDSVPSHSNFDASAGMTERMPVSQIPPPAVPARRIPDPGDQAMMPKPMASTSINHPNQIVLTIRSLLW